MSKTEPKYPIYTTEEERKYLVYIDEHRANVQAVWAALEKHLKGEFWLGDFEMAVMDSHVKSHDESKYSSWEFGGYRQFFFPETLDEKNKGDFNLAWNHHQKHNPHHWEYWIMADGTVLPMQHLHELEMLCDWSAMSLKFGDCPSEFYSKQKDRMILHEITRQVVERWLPLFDEAVQDCRATEG